MLRGLTPRQFTEKNGALYLAIGETPSVTDCAINLTMSMNS